MLKKIEEHILDIEKFEADSIESAEQFRIKYLGKKGVLNDLFPQVLNSKLLSTFELSTWGKKVF